MQHYKSFMLTLQESVVAFSQMDSQTNQTVCNNNGSSTTPIKITIDGHKTHELSINIPNTSAGRDFHYQQDLNVLNTYLVEARRNILEGKIVSRDICAILPWICKGKAYFCQMSRKRKARWVTIN